MKNASGLFNLTRNLGGAVGLALLNTFSTTASICISRGCTKRLHRAAALLKKC